MIYTTKPGDIVDPVLHKSFFKRRLLPYAADIKAGRAADPMIDAYFELLNEYKTVDVSWSDTIAMITDAVNRIKVVVPESAIDAEQLLLPRQSNEHFER